MDNRKAIKNIEERKGNKLERTHLGHVIFLTGCMIVTFLVVIPLSQQ